MMIVTMNPVMIAAKITVSFTHCFISYTEDVVDELNRHAVRSQLYADITQFHDSCRLNDVDLLRTRL